MSKYLSPHVIMSGRNLDLDKNCRIPFETYAKVAEDNNTTKKSSPRTLDEIYLQPLDNKQGGHECMHINTGHVITGYNTKDVSATGLVIKAVEAISA